MTAKLPPSLREILGGPGFDPEVKARSIKACLDYLYDEAMDYHLRLSAHLIGVAAESVDDYLCGRREPYVESSGRPPMSGRKQ